MKPKLTHYQCVDALSSNRLSCFTAGIRSFESIEALIAASTKSLKLLLGKKMVGRGGGIEPTYLMSLFRSKLDRGFLPQRFLLQDLQTIVGRALSTRPMVKMVGPKNLQVAQLIPMHSPWQVPQIH